MKEGFHTEVSRVRGENVPSRISFCSLLSDFRVLELLVHVVEKSAAFSIIHREKKGLRRGDEEPKVSFKGHSGVSGVWVIIIHVSLAKGRLM